MVKSIVLTKPIIINFFLIFFISHLWKSSKNCSVITLLPPSIAVTSFFVEFEKKFVNFVVM
jgi:hypothetical protein